MVDITDNSDYRSLASVLSEGQRQQADAVALRNIQKQEAQKSLLNEILKRHTVVDETTGAAAVDQKAVLGELYRKDPEVARVYETDVAERQLATLKAKQAQTTYDQGQSDRNAKLTMEALSAVDENGDQQVAAQQYADGVRQLKAAGVPIDPSDEMYSRGRVSFLKRQAIGASKIYTEENDLTQNRDTQQAGIEKASISANAGVERARITGEAGVRRAAVTGAYGVQRAGVTAAAKTVGDPAKGGTVDLLGITGPETSGYGTRRDPLTGGSRFHGGVDIAKPLNTPVPAMDSGEVVFAGKKGGYGNQVRIKYDNGREVSYSHLNDTRGLKPGDTVQKGQVVALTGSTGRSTGPHVHVEEYGANGQRVSPQAAAKTGVTPAAVAKAVISSPGSSKLTKQGEITLRTDPTLKAMAAADFETQVNNMDALVEAVKRGASTGPGTGIQNTVDRGLIGLRNMTGLSIGDAEKQNQRATDYATIDRVAGQAATEVVKFLRPVTDADLKRALAQTVGNRQTGKFNVATAVLSRDMAELARQKKNFYIKWANIAGSPLQTINGQTADAAWQAHSSSLQAKIAQTYRRNSGERPGGASSAQRPQAGGKPIEVKSSADYARAPKGSIVVWNGKQYRKP